MTSTENPAVVLLVAATAATAEQMEDSSRPPVDLQKLQAQLVMQQQWINQNLQ